MLAGFSNNVAELGPEEIVINVEPYENIAEMGPEEVRNWRNSVGLGHGGTRLDHVGHGGTRWDQVGQCGTN